MSFPLNLTSKLPVKNNLKVNKSVFKTDAKVNEAEQNILRDLEQHKIIVKPTDIPDTVIGHDDIVISIEDAFLAKFKFETLKDKKGGIHTFLLVGKPGNGKTSIMRNAAIYVAQCLGKPITLFNISASKVLSKWVGESTKYVRLLYDLAEKNAPSLLLYDEVDSIMSSRKEDQSDHSRQFQTEFLTQMDGIESRKGIITVASTNRGFDLDDGFLRRFHRTYHVQEPNSLQRIELLKKAILIETGIEYHKHPNPRLDVNMIIRKTNGFSGAQIFQAVKDAVNATYLHQVNGEIMQKNEYRQYHSQRRGTKGVDDIDLTMGSLSMNILIKEGFERIFVKYEKYEADKMRKWIRENCWNGRQKKVDQNLQATSRRNDCCLLSCFNAF